MMEESDHAHKPATDLEHKMSPEPRVCLNCGTPLSDKYCPHCGQKDLPARQPLGELVTNFIGSFTSFESKFFRTLQYLMFRPGFLPVEYIAGKRERYYHPARAYVFISFLYFLLFLSSSTPEQSGFNFTLSPTQEVTVDTDDENAEEIIDNAIEYESVAEYDSIQSALPANQRDGLVAQAFQRRILFLMSRYEGRMPELGNDMIRLFLDNLPKLFFLLLPIFALLLKALYLRRDFFYAEHLVFTTYFYNFFFLAGILSMLLELAMNVNWLTSVFGIWILVYLLLAMRKMYRQGWGKTIAKYLILLFSIGLCIVAAFMINLFVILFTL